MKQKTGKVTTRPACHFCLGLLIGSQGPGQWFRLNLNLFYVSLHSMLKLYHVCVLLSTCTSDFFLFLLDFVTIYHLTLYPKIWKQLSWTIKLQLKCFPRGVQSSTVKFCHFQGHQYMRRICIWAEIYAISIWAGPYKHVLECQFCTEPF